MSRLFSKVVVGARVTKTDGGAARHQGYVASLYEIKIHDQDETELEGRQICSVNVAFEGYR